MKNTFFAFLFLLPALAFAELTFAEPAVAKPIVAVPAQPKPNAHQAFKALLANAGSMPLASTPHCATMGSGKDDKTVLDYIANMLAFQTESPTGNRIQYDVKPAASGNWQADLTFRGANDEDVWNMGVRFALQPDGALVQGSLLCTGG